MNKVCYFFCRELCETVIISEDVSVISIPNSCLGEDEFVVIKQRNIEIFESSTCKGHRQNTYLPVSSRIVFGDGYVERFFQMSEDELRKLKLALYLTCVLVSLRLIGGSDVRIDMA